MCYHLTFNCCLCLEWCDYNIAVEGTSNEQCYICHEVLSYCYLRSRLALLFNINPVSTPMPSPLIINPDSALEHSFQCRLHRRMYRLWCDLCHWRSATLTVKEI